MNINLEFVKVFDNDAGRKVLKYLAAFAEADNADFIADQRKSDYIQGRRSVVMEIRKILKEGEQTNV